jgi:hypothetical protein
VVVRFGVIGTAARGRTEQVAPAADHSTQGRLGHVYQGWLVAARSAVELTVEGDSGVDQGQVGEGLREVAELLACRSDLFEDQAEVVAVGGAPLVVC